MVLDINSNALHLLDDISYEVIDYIENENLENALSNLSNYSKKDIIETYNELLKLKSEGLLFSPDPVERIEYGEPVIKSMCLNVSHDCNLRCKYCFASTGNFKGARELMSYDVGKHAIDFLIEHSAGRRHLEVDMFGGEPLMNYDVMKAILEYGRGESEKAGKNINFTITTNALSLTHDKIDYINDNFYNVVLSLDGRPEVNDRMRPDIKGSGSYAHIVDNIIEMAKKRKNKEYYVRGTYTRYNLDFAEDVKYMVDLGLNRVSVEPVVTSPSSDYCIRYEDLPVIKEQYIKLANEYINRSKQGRPFDFFHFDIDLEKGPCIYKRIKGCGVGSEYIAVVPNGDIYPCHQFVGINEFRMGNVIDGTVNVDMQKAFMHNNITTKSKCQKCWVKYFCSGGCHANAYQYSGDISKTHDLSCEILKIRTECALMIKAALSE